MNKGRVPEERRGERCVAAIGFSEARIHQPHKRQKTKIWGSNR